MSRPLNATGLPTPPVVTAASRIALTGANLRSINAGTPASATSPFDVAPAILAFPFVLEVQTSIYKGFFVNGTAPGNNSEVSLWDASYNRLATTGSVVGSVASAPQATAWTTGTIVLPQGRYYASMGHDATTTNQVWRWLLAAAGNEMFQMMGCWKQTGITLGSLPTTATPASLTSSGFPIFGFITRSVFDL